MKKRILGTPRVLTEDDEPSGCDTCGQTLPRSEMQDAPTCPDCFATDGTHTRASCTE